MSDNPKALSADRMALRAPNNLFQQLQDTSNEAQRT